MQNVGGNYKMQQYSTHINSTKLSKVLQITFDRLPNEFLKAYESFLKSRSTTYFRESIISKWISIPVATNIIFKTFDQTHRLTNIFFQTIKMTKTEFQIYLNKNGIIGVNIGENLEDLIIDSIDTSKFIIEKIPISKFLIDQADLEYLSDFIEIEDYLDNKYTSEVYNIGNTQYFGIITLSDKNCVAINDKKSVFLLNKISGQTKQIFKRPQEFITAFKNNELIWLEDI